MKLVAAALGFNRGTIAIAIGSSSIPTAFVNSFFGRLIDRHGVRPTLMALIVVFAACVAAMSLLQRSGTLLFGLFAVSGLVVVGLCGVAPVTGTFIHIVPLLTDRGTPTSRASSWTASLLPTCAVLVGISSARAARVVVPGGRLLLAGFIVFAAFLVLACLLLPRLSAYRFPARRPAHRMGAPSVAGASSS